MIKKLKKALSVAALAVSIALVMTCLGLAAQASPGTYTVVFDLRYGSGTVSDMQVTDDGVYGALPTEVSRDGFTFEGWWTTVTGGEEIISGAPVDLTKVDVDYALNEIYLYARWSQRTGFRIYFNYGSGSGVPEYLDVKDGDTVELPEPSLANHHFAGWWTSAAGGEEVKTGESLELTSDRTLYARWAAKTVPQLLHFSEYDMPVAEYTGIPQAIPEVSANDDITGMGPIEVYYTGAPGGTQYAKSKDAPANAGVYEITLEISEGVSYASGEVTLGNYFIAQKEVAREDISYSPKSVEYTGTSQGINQPTPASGLTGMGVIDNIRYTLVRDGMGNAVSDGVPTIARPTEAGTYEVTVSVGPAPGGNFIGDGNVVIGNFEITRIAPTAGDIEYTIPTGDEYTGEEQGIGTVTPVSGMGTVTVNYNGLPARPVNAGTYAVSFDVTGGNNYLPAEGLPAGTYIISRYALTLFDLTLTQGGVTGAFELPENHIFNGAQQGISGTVGVALPLMLGETVLTVRYDNLAVRPTNAGTYAVTVSVTAGENYTDATLYAGEYIIAKDWYVPVLPTAQGAFYYETLLSQWTFSFDPRGTWSWDATANDPLTTVPVVGNTGSTGYWAVFKFEDTSNNYEGVSDGAGRRQVSVPVLQLSYTPALPTVTGAYEYGRPLSEWELSIDPVTTPVGTPRGTWSWDATANDPLTTLPVVGNMGYTAVYTLTDSNNYNLVAGGGVTVSGGKGYATRIVTVNRRAGADVDRPELDNYTNSTVTVKAVAVPWTGQEVVYSIDGGANWQA